MSLCSAMAVLLIDHVQVARGFYIFAIVNAAIYAALLLVIIVQHARENGVRLTRLAETSFLRQASVVLAVASFAPAAAWVRGAPGIEALTWRAQRLSITAVSYSVAGAGQSGSGVRQVRLLPRWLEHP